MNRTSNWAELALAVVLLPCVLGCDAIEPQQEPVVISDITMNALYSATEGVSFHDTDTGPDFCDQLYLIEDYLEEINSPWDLQDYFTDDDGSSSVPVYVAVSSVVKGGDTLSFTDGYQQDDIATTSWNSTSKSYQPKSMSLPTSDEREKCQDSILENMPPIPESECMDRFRLDIERCCTLPVYHPITRQPTGDGFDRCVLNARERLGECRRDAYGPGGSQPSCRDGCEDEFPGPSYCGQPNLDPIRITICCIAGARQDACAQGCECLMIEDPFLAYSCYAAVAAFQFTVEAACTFQLGACLTR